MCTADIDILAISSSLALISARATINSLEVLTMLTASYIYALCQGTISLTIEILFCLSWNVALDLRALQAEFIAGLKEIASDEVNHFFGSALSGSVLSSVTSQIFRVMREKFEATSSMDAAPRMDVVAAASTTTLVDFFTGPGFDDLASAGTFLTAIPKFRATIARRATALLDQLRVDYLSSARGKAPASMHLNRTRSVYEFVRITLGIRMHGSENYNRFVNGLGVEDVTIGQNVSLIHEVRPSVLDTFSIPECTFFFCLRRFVMEKCRPSLLTPSPESFVPHKFFLGDGGFFTPMRPVLFITHLHSRKQFHQ
jgi:phenylalanine ammonia-lyase